MANITLTQVATAALQKLHAISSGEPVTAQMLTDALDRMNNLIDNWSLEQAMCMPLQVQSFNLVVGTRKYAIGTGQAFNVVRPVEIVAANHSNTVYTTTYESPIKILTAAQWADLPDRISNSFLIRSLFYDKAFPNGNIYVSPVPLGGTLELTFWQALAQFADATTPITTQFPGYARLYECALAIEWAPELGLNPDQALVLEYQDAIARIRNLNAGAVIAPPPEGQTSAASAPPAPITEARS